MWWNLWVSGKLFRVFCWSSNTNSQLQWEWFRVPVTELKEIRNYNSFTNLTTTNEIETFLRILSYLPHVRHKMLPREIVACSWRFHSEAQFVWPLGQCSDFCKLAEETTSIQSLSHWGVYFPQRAELRKIPFLPKECLAPNGGGCWIIQFQIKWNFNR